MALKLNISELKGAQRCLKALKTKKLTRASSVYIDKVIFVKNMIHNLMTGAMTMEELEDTVRTAFQSFGWRSSIQADYQAGDAYRQIRRYVEAEQKIGRKPYYPAPKTVTLIRGLDVTVRVDVMFWRNGADKDGNPMTFVEAVVYKSGKPTFTQRAADQGQRVALELYAIMKYLRTFLKDDKDMHLKASVYWLRKNSDTHASLDGATAAVFNDDFFDLKAAGNIVSLEETWRGGILDVDKKQEWDRIYKPVCIAVAKGIDEKECTDKDCEACVYRDACKYTVPVMHINSICAARHLPDLMLTEAQEEVTMITSGAHRVNAGAGSGKTLVVALLIANLIAEGAEPEGILAITFTVSAADELRERVRLYVEDLGCEPECADRVRIMTFNAFGYEQVKKDYAKLGFTAEPKVIDSIENFRIITGILNSQPEIKGLDYRNFTMDMPHCKGALIAVADIFDVIKQENLGYGDETDIATVLRNEKGYSVRNSVITEVIKLYDVYDAHLREENLIRFDDQLTMLQELLYQDPFYFEQFKLEHILVDEFQDTDQKQLDLIKRMCKTPTWKSLTVVGDDSQSIYSFRHTSPEFIIHFDEYMADIVEVEDHYLLNNYRCTGNVLSFANGINDLNINKVAKSLIATREDGEAVHVLPFFDNDKNVERKFIVDRIERYIKNGTSPEDIAILAFRKSELAIMGAMLAERGIQAVMMSPQKVSENSRVLAGISMLKAMRDRTDEKSLFTYASALVDGGLVGKPENEANEAIVDAVAKLDSARVQTTDAAKKTRIIELLKELDRNEDEVFASFIATLEFKPTTDKIYEYADDVKDFGDKAEVRCSHEYPGVVLTTAHSSKGLEWPIVFNMISSYDSERVHDNRDRIEEMRRLLFVTSTRARDVLYVTGNAVAYKSKSDDGRITKVVYNRFLMDSLSVIFGRTVTIDDMARWHAAFNAGKAKHKALTAPAKPKKKTSKKKKSSKAPVSEPSAAPEAPEIIRPVKKLSGMTVWAKKRCKKHGRKSRKGGKR